MTIPNKLFGMMTILAYYYHYHNTLEYFSLQRRKFCCLPILISQKILENEGKLPKSSTNTSSEPFKSASPSGRQRRIGWVNRGLKGCANSGRSVLASETANSGTRAKTADPCTNPAGTYAVWGAWRGGSDRKAENRAREAVTRGGGAEFKSEGVFTLESLKGCLFILEHLSAVTLSIPSPSSKHQISSLRRPASLTDLPDEPSCP